MNYLSRYFFVLSILLAFNNFSYSQTWKTWDAAHMSFSFSKKLSAKLVYNKSFEMTNSWNNDFNQATFQTDYDINKHFSVRGAMVYTYYGSNSTIRGLVRGTHSFNISNKISWSNGLQFEYHNSNESRYRERIIYVTRVGLTKRLKFLKLAPSVSYMLYYNIGGDPIQYYDDAGNKSVKQAANGFHRGRVYMNLNSKISKNFSVSLYYMKQNEFNFLCPKDREINYVKPGGTTVRRPYDKYNVAGLSLMYNFKLYKSKKKSSNSKSKKSSNNAPDKKDIHLQRDL